jgi:ATPase subunit of ABC transporter with duplicated ATPase domains
VLVLDEPTNDLDIDTLELLEELLQTYAGTVFLVSHDRRFLDNVVTSTIVAEGEGRWREYEGGVEDWLLQSERARQAQAEAARRAAPAAAPAAPAAGGARRRPRPGAPSSATRSSASWMRCRPASRRSRRSSAACPRNWPTAACTRAMPRARGRCRGATPRSRTS